MTTETKCKHCRKLYKPDDNFAFSACTECGIWICWRCRRLEQTTTDDNGREIREYRCPPCYSS